MRECPGLHTHPAPIPLASSLHHQRLDAVVRELLAGGARSVADLGCGSGELLQRLRGEARFTRLIGIDIDPGALAEARAVLGLDLLKPDDRLQVRLGSFEDTDWGTPEVDAAVMLETIEHVEPARLPRVEHLVFNHLRPAQVLITTPNREYNALHGLSPRQRRHLGHRFEWTRIEFRTWCDALATRQGFRVRYVDIGPGHPLRGSSTQMACFSLCSPG